MADAKGTVLRDSLRQVHWDFLAPLRSSPPAGVVWGRQGASSAEGPFSGWEGPYLRGHEIRCVAGRHEQPVLGSQLLGKPKVADSDGFRVSRLVHVQDVTWLQVPVDDLQGREHRPA